MKRNISLILGIILLFSLAISPTYAQEVNDEFATMSDGIGLSDYQGSSDGKESELVQLLDANDYQSITLDDSVSSEEAIDFPSDVVMEALQGNSNLMTTASVTENQPPVANPGYAVLNPETMRDGKYTTETWIYIATRWNGTDLCYDPDGDSITLLIKNNFPIGYFHRVTDTVNGTYDGFAINITNAGNYLLEFTFMDSNGAESQPFNLDFEILPRGIYEIIDDSISSEQPSKDYEITVDYATADEYCVGMMRTGLLGFSVSIFDESDNEVDTQECFGPGTVQRVKNRIMLPRPDGVTGEYTYRITITGNFKGASTQNNNINYRLAYGESSQSYYFFEGVENAIDLPYYHFIRDYQQVEAEYASWAPLSDSGEYYKFTAIGPEVVTLRSKYGSFRFKIVDPNSMRVLYDGINLPSNLVTYLGSVNEYITRAKINFTIGQTYYVVVYAPNITYNPIESYTISVGEPHIKSEYVEIPLEPKTFIKGQNYEWPIELESPNGNPAYIDHIRYSASGAGWPFENGHYSILTPGTSSWIQSGLYGSTIDFNFDNPSAALVRADGTWKLRITAGQSGNYQGTKLTIYYAYEL